MADLPGQPAPKRLRLFTVGAAFQTGWSVFKERYRILLFGSLGYLAISFVLGLIQGRVEQILGIPGLLSLPMAFLVTAQLAAGYGYFAVRCVRGEPVTVDSLFDGFRRYWTIAGIQVLLALVGVLCALPALLMIVAGGVASGLGGGAAGPLLLVLGIVITVVFILTIAVRFSLAATAALDSAGRPGPTDAMRLSWAMTASPNWALLIIVGLLLGVISLASLIALILPFFFFALPLVTAVWGATYNLMAAEIGVDPYRESATESA